MKKDITEAEILEQLAAGFDCSQVVLTYFADRLRLERTLALKVAAAFGGGMWKGRTCGAVSGALMAIGLKYGHEKAGDSTAKNVMLEKCSLFEEKFSVLSRSCVCKEILGYDLSTKDGMAEVAKQNLLATKCPRIVLYAVEAVEEIL